MRPTLPWLTRPGKIICVGLTYHDHAREPGMTVPEQPLLFGKWPTSVIGPGDPIVIPPCSARVDYEAQLGLIIGRHGRDLPPDEALDHVAGAVCVNDIGARDLQFADGQWTRSKSFDSFVAHASQSVTLEPGDLIATGTPAGVGYGRTRPRFLQSGDAVTVEIDGIVALTNPVIGSRPGHGNEGGCYGR